MTATVDFRTIPEIITRYYYLLSLLLVLYYYVNFFVECGVWRQVI